MLGGAGPRGPIYAYTDAEGFVLPRGDITYTIKDVGICVYPVCEACSAAEEAGPFVSDLWLMTSLWGLLLPESIGSIQALYSSARAKQVH